LDEIRNSTFHDMDIEFYKLTQYKLEDLTVKETIAIILDHLILVRIRTICLECISSTNQFQFHWYAISISN
jgi:hypothetical protein